MKYKLVLLNTLSDRMDNENPTLDESPLHIPLGASESLGSPSKCCHFVCSVHKLLELIGTNCRTKGCDKKCHITYTYCGSCMVMKGMCGDGHGFTWTSSDTLANKAGCNVFTDNLDIASAVQLSGNNFAKILLFFRFLNIPVISETTFHSYQRNYICTQESIISIKQNMLVHVLHCCVAYKLYFCIRKNFWRSIMARALYWLEMEDVTLQIPVQNCARIHCSTSIQTKFCMWKT